MNPEFFVVTGLFVVACVLAFWRSRRDDWNTHQLLGARIFLTGAAIGLFLDDVVGENSPVIEWIEPVGALVMIVGLFVWWRSD